MDKKYYHAYLILGTERSTMTRINSYGDKDKWA